VARGVVSPTGASFVGDIREKEGLIAVQRIVLDDKIVSAATKLGAVFRPNTPVRVRHTKFKIVPFVLIFFQLQNAIFDRIEGTWTLYAGGDSAVGQPDPSTPHFGFHRSPATSPLRHSHSAGPTSFAAALDGVQSGAVNTISESELADMATIIKCRVLVCADGAQSSLAHHLEGLTAKESPASSLGPPNAIGCRAFAKQYTHECRADEVCVYSQPLLPGYFRIFAELDDYLNLTCFMLPSMDDNSQAPTQAQVRTDFQLGK